MQSQPGAPSKFPDISASFVASGTFPSRGPVERPLVQGEDVDMSNMPQEQRSYIHRLQSRLQLIDNQILVLRERRAHLQRLGQHFPSRR